MELNINSPAYYSQNYGIDNDVYSFCQKAYLFFKDKEYSSTLKTIGIVPAVAPQELYDNNMWKEEIKLINNKSVAGILLRMDFEEYHNADTQKKILMTKNLVLKAVKKVKARGKFDYKAFEKDFTYLSEEYMRCIK